MNYYINASLCIGCITGVGSEVRELERRVTSLGGVKVEPGAGGKKGPVGEIVPPVLSEEQASAMWLLKPFLKALADVNRIAILQELSLQDGLSVLDLSDRLMLSQPLTSWHLHILKRARLVKPTHLGRQRIYRLDRARLKEYRQLFDWVTDF